MDKESISMALDKIPELPRSIAQRQKRQDLVDRFERVSHQVTQVKSSLREKDLLMK